MNRVKNQIDITCIR